MKTLNVNDGTLDEFVREYCEGNNIECDGDVMGIMFSGEEEYTVTEAVLLIEKGAKIYELKR